MAEKQTQKKPFPLKPVVAVAAIVLVLGIFAYIYLWYTNTAQKAAQADAALTEAANYKVLSGQIEAELTRCRAFIAQEQGEFGQFEYCKRFINWANLAKEDLVQIPAN